MPIYHKVEQRSAHWFALRIGKPTASDFHRIVTAGGVDGKKVKVSDQAEAYAHRLLAEMMLGRALEESDYQSQYMTRGVELEDSGFDAYEFATGLETSPGGFVTDDLGRYGCSPDRLVGDKRMLEMKIPAASTHVRYLVSPGTIKAEKRPQAQGQLLVCEREAVDLVSYHPEMPLAVVTAYREEDYIAKLRDALDAFCASLQAMREKFEREFGPFPTITIDKPAAPAEDGLGVSEEDVHALWEASQHG
jgi:hypothetical protein